MCNDTVNFILYVFILCKHLTLFYLFYNAIDKFKALSVCRLYRSLVFQSVHSHSRTLPRYYLLCVVQAAASYCGTYLLYRYLLLPEVWAKVVVDTLLFFASFQIQRRWIFCSRAKTSEKEGEQ